MSRCMQLSRDLLHFPQLTICFKSQAYFWVNISITSDNELFVQNINILEANIDAEIGANGNIRAKAYGDVLNYIKGRKKRSPGFGKRFKKAFKKVVRIPKKVVVSII